MALTSQRAELTGPWPSAKLNSVRSSGAEWSCWGLIMVADQLWDMVPFGLAVWCGSALDRACGHALDDLPVEEDEHDQRRDGDQQDRGEEQVVLGGELALEVEQGELHGGVLGSGQEVQRVLEVVVDEHDLQDDHGHDNRAQHREDDPEEDLYGSGAVDDCGFVEFAWH